jgi:uncharacterized membrane protein (DUF4010 family)
MSDGLDLDAIRNFGTALLIGALVGIEREKRKAGEDEPSIGGLRTFVVMALLGALGGSLAGLLHAPIVLVAVIATAGVVVLAGYVVGARKDPESLGLTTESAAIAVCLLGAMTTLGHREIAVPLGIVTAAVLAYKQPLHGFVEKIRWDDIYAGLRLLIATFIVLPLLPDEPIDPWGALKPYSLWLLVLLISSLSLVGYVGNRWLGAERGIVLAGLTGGLVSSTAVTLSCSRQSKDDAGRTSALLASAILLAWCIMFGRVVVEVLVVNRALVSSLLVPFVAMGVVAAAIAGTLYWRAASRGGRSKAAGEVPLRNPFSLTQAAKFGAFFAVVLLVVKFVQTRFPGQGLYMVAGLAGLTDVDAITLSMAEYAIGGGDAHVARNAIVIATLSNTVVKCGMVVALGAGALSRPIVLATVAILGVGLGALALS